MHKNIPKINGKLPQNPYPQNCFSCYVSDRRKCSKAHHYPLIICNTYQFVGWKGWSNMKRNKGTGSLCFCYSMPIALTRWWATLRSWQNAMRSLARPWLPSFLAMQEMTIWNCMVCRPNASSCSVRLLQYTDRTSPMDKHVQLMADNFEISGAPLMPQMFGNAGIEHMKSFGMLNV